MYLNLIVLLVDKVEERKVAVLHLDELVHQLGEVGLLGDLRDALEGCLVGLDGVLLALTSQLLTFLCLCGCRGKNKDRRKSSVCGQLRILPTFSQNFMHSKLTEL